MSTAEKLPIKLRRPRPGDYPVVMDSWLKSHQKHSHNGVRRMKWLRCGCGTKNETPYPLSPVKSDVYFEEQRWLINALLENSQLLIACLDDDDDQVFGWVCYAPSVLHYIYVKVPYRKMGVGRLMLDEAGITAESPATFTHITGKAFRFLGKRMKAYNPYELYRRIHGQKEEESR